MIVCISWFCHACEGKWADFLPRHWAVTRGRCPFCGAPPDSTVYRRC